jgi:hypothetical protein
MVMLDMWILLGWRQTARQDSDRVGKAGRMAPVDFPPRHPAALQHVRMDWSAADAHPVGSTLPRKARLYTMMGFIRQFPGPG